MRVKIPLGNAKVQHLTGTTRRVSEKRTEKSVTDGAYSKFGYWNWRFFSAIADAGNDGDIKILTFKTHQLLHVLR